MAYMESFRGAMNSDVGFAGATIAGGLLGAVQTILLRQFVDIPMAKSFLKDTSNAPPLLMKQLKGFGSASALVGIIAGAVASVIGIMGIVKGKFLKDKSVAGAVAGYGVLALSTGLLSGAFPANEWRAAMVVDPSNPIGQPAIQRVARNEISRTPERTFKPSTLEA